MSRYFFFDDIPAIVESLIKAWEDNLPLYIEMETSRISDARKRDMGRLKERIKKDPDDWRNKLLDIERQIDAAGEDDQEGC